MMQAATAHVLAVPEAEILDIREIQIEPPGKARIFASIACDRCGEPVADMKTRTLDGVRVCIPCAESISRERGNRAP
jgi:formylmethanofuran dehydrogenase subunit E